MDATDLNHIGSRASDVGSHAVQEIGNVYYVRFFCHVLHDSDAFCHRCRHHYIDRRPYCHDVEINMPPFQILCFGNYFAVLDIHVGSECAEPLQVLVYRPAPDIASSRKCHFRSLVLAKQRAEQIVRRADLLDIVILHIKIPDTASVDLDRVSVYAVHLCTDSGNCIQ